MNDSPWPMPVPVLVRRQDSILIPTEVWHPDHGWVKVPFHWGITVHPGQGVR